MQTATPGPAGSRACRPLARDEVVSVATGTTAPEAAAVAVAVLMLMLVGRRRGRAGRWAGWAQPIGAAQWSVSGCWVRVR